MPSKPSKPKAPQSALNFAALVEAVRQVHESSATAASRAVNASLTLRNWAIGCYIVEYEQNGADRAEYGERMMDRLADALRQRGVPTSDRQRLYAYVGFYRAYPQIGEVIPAAWAAHVLPAPATRQSAIFRSPTGKSAEATRAKEIVRSATGICQTPGRMLADRLSYTHLELLAGLEDSFKRAFYEIECIRGNWSVRALRRCAFQLNVALRSMLVACCSSRPSPRSPGVSPWNPRRAGTSLLRRWRMMLVSRMYPRAGRRHGLRKCLRRGGFRLWLPRDLRDHTWSRALARQDLYRVQVRRGQLSKLAREYAARAAGAPGYEKTSSRLLNAVAG